MQSKRVKFLISIGFVILSLGSYALSASAAAPFDPFGPDDYSWYNYDYNPGYYPLYIYGRKSSQTTPDRLDYSDDGSITRTIDDVIYSASTYVYSPEVNIVQPYQFFFSPYEASGWYDGLDRYVGSFTDMDVYIIVNIYGSGAVLPSDPVVEASFNNVHFFEEMYYQIFNLSLDSEIVASQRFSAQSVTYVIHLSLHGDQLYGLNSFSENDEDSRFNSYFRFSLTSESGYFCENLIDVDMGFVAARIGHRIVKYVDIWGNVPPLPKVSYPDVDDASAWEFFGTIEDIDIFKNFIVPLGLVTIGFFMMRSILWKGV